MKSAGGRFTSFFHFGDCLCRAPLFRYHWPALSCALLTWFVVDGRGAAYTFTNIVDTTGPFSDFGTPSINNSGTTAFLGLLDADGTGIYKSSGGGVITPVAVSGGGTFSGFGTAGTPINAAGRVAFLGDPVMGGSGIYTSDGSNLTTIAVGSTPPFAAFPLTTALGINSSGTVVFETALSGGGTAIYKGGGGVPSALYLSTDPMFSLFNVPVAINDSGIAAFNGLLDAGGSGIFSGDGGPVTSVALSSGQFVNFTGNQVSINATGAVAFVGGLDTGGSGVFTGSGGAITTITTNRAPYANFNYPAINGAGKVAFFASLNTGAAGIFSGPDAVTNKIIRTGDPLFGSTVNNLRFRTDAYNDAGQAAFFYTLTDGRRGIAVASPANVRILSITQIAGGTMHLEISGATNLSHTILATTNLSQPFAAIGSQVAPASGLFHYDDTNAPAFRQRFYEVSLP